MTAEIVIMNKTAIALAADSAVTIQVQQKQRRHKVYKTVNKLFMLSKFEPIGIMLYGDAEFMGLSWETIIKVYRNELGERKLSTLQEYANDFLAFLERATALFPESIQLSYFLNIVASYFKLIRNEIDKVVEPEIQAEGEISDSRLSRIATEVIKKHQETWEGYEELSNISKNYGKEMDKKYRKDILQIKDKVFQKLNISEASSKRLKKIAINLFCRKRLSEKISGLVVAGFGDTEIFPSQFSYRIESLVNGKLKYVPDVSTKLDYRTTASVTPFAQGQMVHTFMEGIDPNYLRSLEESLYEIFDGYPQTIAKHIPHLETNEKEDLVEKLRTVGKGMVDNYLQSMSKYRRGVYIDPVINTVAFLPKEELAAMAESLVNLTSFKQRITMDAETVSGPIDVALISKGDGFVWIKRKHYFKPELNPHFFANYYRGTPVENGGEDEEK